jgi:predicted HD phosphohydrolase
MPVTPILQERTREDWAEREKEVIQYNQATPSRINQMLLAMAQIDSHSSINQLEHSLQTATRAARCGASDEMIVAALCHDISKLISTENHAAVAAEILKPFVGHATYEIIRTHTDFQARYFRAHLGPRKDPRDKYRRQPWFAAACQFADEWDMPARDPSYDTYSLEYFWPLLEKIFSEPKVQRSSLSIRLLRSLSKSMRRLLSRFDHSGLRRFRKGNSTDIPDSKE